MALFARVAYDEVAFSLRAAEDLSDIALGGHAHGAVVRGDSLDGHRPRGSIGMQLRPSGVIGRTGFGPALQHQRRQDLDIREEGLPVKCLGQHGRETLLGLFVGKARVGGAQLHVCHQAVEEVRAALDDHEGALLHAQGIDGQADAEGFLRVDRADYIANSSQGSFISPQRSQSSTKERGPREQAA